MSQLVTRVSDELASAMDDLIDRGAAESRSDLVRRALELYVDLYRRRQVGREIVAGYEATPQTADEMGWADAATTRMITEEPW